jgi:hypothetical protein
MSVAIHLGLDPASTAWPSWNSIAPLGLINSPHRRKQGTFYWLEEWLAAAER